MLYTPLEFYPPTGSLKARYIIENKLQEFNGVSWEVVANEDEQKAALAALAEGNAGFPSEVEAPAAATVPVTAPAVAKPK